jgi:hypothetical protein
MTLKDRLRGRPAGAVAGIQPPAPAPYGQPRRLRSRLLVLAAAALALVLAAAVVVAAANKRRIPSAGPTTPGMSSGSAEFRDPSRNLRFSYPPDWVVKPHPQIPNMLLAIPPTFAGQPLDDWLPFVLAIQPNARHYLGAVQAEVSKGRLRGRRPYVRVANDAVVSPPQVQPPVRRWYDTYYIDWGRYCASFPPAPEQDCGAHSVTATLAAASESLLDRYRPMAAAIVQGLAPDRATGPSYGDRQRPPCRPDQWRLAPEYGWSFINESHSWLIRGAALSRGQGPPCHLRATIELVAERSDGTALPLPRAPAPITIEGDLPEDTSGIRPTDSLIPPTPLTWHWAWRNWCRQPLAGVRVRVTGPDGQTASKQPPPLRDYMDEGRNPCKGVGSSDPWTIARWP